MRSGIFKILVTGGAGFIGSEFMRQAVRRGYKVILVDKLTYAGDLKRLNHIKVKYAFYNYDICSHAQVKSVLRKERPRALINFAAETHVDRSILDPRAFLQTNITGAQVLLDISKKHGIEKFIHVSTDETYGDIKKGGFSETCPLKPNSPYAASKAAADLLIRSYIRTYGFEAIIARPSNNYGPWQYPEKLIPVAIYKALRNEKIPVYASGLNMREWLNVSDCAEAVCLILEKGKKGEIYNIGSGHEEKNINVVKEILDILSKPYSLIRFVKDRPGHDYRYFLDSAKMRKLGWRPKICFKKGLKETVNWYLNNLDWLNGKAKDLRGYWRKVYRDKGQ